MMSDTLRDYQSLVIPILLLGGGKSPTLLRVALDALESTLPAPSRKTFPTLRHDGPENDGRPDLVAKELRDFFLGAANSPSSGDRLTADREA